MFHKTVLFFMLLLTAIFGFTQQDAIYFAAGTEGLVPFTSMFQNGHFVPLSAVLTNPHENYKKQLAEALRQFPIKKSVAALGESGRLYELTISAYDPNPDIYPILKLQNPPNELTLATNAAVKLTYLPSKAAELSIKELNMLREKALEIWEKERIQLGQLERPQPQLTILTPKILGIEVLPDIVTVVFPVSFSGLWRDPGVDTRGSVFFLFDRKAGKILRGNFGHPEWSPSSPDSLILIQPHMFFRITDFASPYLLANFSYGWESHGLLIINLTNGDLEAFSTYY